MLSCCDLAPSLLPVPGEAEPVYPGIWHSRMSRVLWRAGRPVSGAAAVCCRQTGCLSVCPGEPVICGSGSWVMKVEP